MTKRRVENPDVRRRQILQGAQAALREKPYHELVMDDVAQAAGISKGLLYLYFKDKEQLFAAVTLDIIRQIRERHQKLGASESPAKDLENWVRELLNMGEELQEFSSQFVGEQLMAGQHAQNVIQAYQELLSEMGNRLQEAIRAGLLRPHDVELSADFLLTLIQFYLRRKSLLQKNPKPLADYAPEILTLFLRGFGGEQAPTA